MHLLCHAARSLYRDSSLAPALRRVSRLLIRSLSLPNQSHSVSRGSRLKPLLPLQNNMPTRFPIVSLAVYL
jgi:hypothetical protein